MAIPPPPIDFADYDAAKQQYDAAETDYKAKSTVRDQAQVQFDAAQAALDEAVADLDQSNGIFQISLNGLVTECDKIGVPYPPQVQQPLQLPAGMKRR